MTSLQMSLFISSSSSSISCRKSLPKSHIKSTSFMATTTKTIMSILLHLITITIIFQQIQFVQSTLDSKSHLLKITTTIMIENDGNTPIIDYLIDCDERNGHSKLSNIAAKLSNDSPMPVTKTEDGKWWRIDLSTKPIEPGASTPLIVTKVYTHLELVPSHDVYLMPYSSIQYQVRIIKQGRTHQIKVPSEQYYLVVDNQELVDLEESTSTVLALDNEGSTKIRFVDKKVISDEDFIQPECAIHIVKPSYLVMKVKPGDSWALQKFTDYTIEISIYDENQHQIYPSDNIEIQLTSSNELLLTNSTSNGTLHTIHTLTTGPAKLTARLSANTPTLYSHNSQDIEITQDLEIFEPLDLKPTAIVLPWLPDTRPSYQVFVYAAGGTGSYKWSSNNTALTEIDYSADDSSVVKVTTSNEGYALIQCTDMRSPVFTKQSLILVAKIVEISVLPGITETEVGGDILLPIAVFANATSMAGSHIPNDEIEYGLVMFHDCSKIKFDVEIVEKSRFSFDADEVITSSRPKSCASLKFTCTQPGSSRVWISYTDTSNPLTSPIKMTTTIACFKPLRPVYPEEVGVIALQTSLELAFEGGPRPFGSRIDDHYSRLQPYKSSIVTFTPIIDRYRYNKDLHVFKAFCHEYGEVTATLIVGNQPSGILPNPASSETSIKIVCGKPDSIELRPRLKDGCPLNSHGNLVDTVVPISTSTPTDFEIVVFDDLKRPFLNISSFKIDWQIQGPGAISSKQIEDVNAVYGFRKTVRNYVTAEPKRVEGQGTIEAHLSPLKNQHLRSSLYIEFVNYATINPSNVIVYNHDKNVVVLSIFKGSGHFAVESLESKHANVTYVSVFGQHRVNIRPSSPGKLNVRIEDRCLITEQPISSEVTIMNDEEFSKEFKKPDRSVGFCRSIDGSFCIFLSVNKMAPRSTTTSRAPPTTPRSPSPSPPTTSAPVTMAVKPAVVERVMTTPTPAKLSFDDATISNDNAGDDKRYSASSIVQRVIGWMILFVVTASTLTFGYKWWQDQLKARPNPQFVTDSSFLRHTPSHHSSSTRLSPTPTSKQGPSSSTPKARPLYTERFSTTLFSD